MLLQPLLLLLLLQKHKGASRDSTPKLARRTRGKEGGRIGLYRSSGALACVKHLTPLHLNLFRRTREEKERDLKPWLAETGLLRAQPTPAELQDSQ